MRRYRATMLSPRTTLTVSATMLAVVLMGCSSNATPSSAKTSGSSSLAPKPSSSSSSAAGSPSASLASLVPDSLRGKTITVAFGGDAPPDVFHQNGALTGWQVDLTNAALELLGLKSTQSITSFDGLIPGLQNGKFDIAPDSFFLTPARLAVVDFVTVSTVGTGFGVNNGSGIKIEKAEDLCGLTVATLAGSAFPAQIATISQQCAGAGKSSASVQTYPDVPTAALAVTNGRAKVLAVTTNRLDYYNKTTGGQLVASPFTYNNQVEGEAFPPKSPLVKPFQAAINQLIANGEYAKILAKYGVSRLAINSAEVRTGS